MNVASIIAVHLEAVKYKVEARISELGKNATGKTSASLQVQSFSDGGSLLGSSALLSMERGRGPGKVPKNFVETIKDWIKAKGINVPQIQSKRASSLSAYERGLNSLAGAIAHSIMKKGTRLYQKKGYDDIFATALEEEIEALGNELVLSIMEQSSDINNILE